MKVISTILLTLAVFSSSVSAHPGSGRSEAMASCIKAVERELGLTNYDTIARRIGVKNLGRGTYAFYFNVNVRGDSPDNAVQSVKVYCRSAGFAKVREMRTSEGTWVYKTRSDQRHQQMVRWPPLTLRYNSDISGFLLLAQGCGGKVEETFDASVSRGWLAPISNA